MSFIGTQQKCKACEKTVYPVELLSADGVDYHKSCFKCSHYKGTLKLNNYSSMEGVFYCNCKPHFEQLFKEAGSFSKNFQTPAKSAEKLTPEMTRSPSKAAGMFSGTQDKCATCGKTAYPLEKVTVENQSYHKSCFKCSHGGCPLSPSNYAALDGILYCKPHFSQLFKEKDSYNHLIKSASVKRPTVTVPDSGTRFLSLLSISTWAYDFLVFLLFFKSLISTQVKPEMLDHLLCYVYVICEVYKSFDQVIRCSHFHSVTCEN